ncbi:MAG: hypothetical protein ABFS12_17475 [Bacteroidota bacterium]
MRNSILIIMVMMLLGVKNIAQPVIPLEHQKKSDIYQHNKKLKYDFKKDARKLSMYNDIDFTSVYIHKYYSESYKDSTFYFIRFFNDGRVFMSDYYYSEPTEKECNNLTYGRRGYYRIREFIEMEFYINGYDGYWIYVCEIYDDKLSYKEKKPRFFPFLTLKKEKQLIEMVIYNKDVHLYTDESW